MEFIIDLFALIFGTTTVVGTLSAMVLLIGSVVALFIYARKAYRGWKRFKCKVNTFYDVVVGDEAITDPQTGKVLVEARLPIGNRVAILEDALKSIAESLARMTAIEETLAGIVKHQEAHEKWSQDWIANHEATVSHDHQKIWEAINRLSTEPQP